MSPSNSLGRSTSDFHSFIEAVASSNLETFHSKGIAWTFNNLPETDSFFTRLMGRAHEFDAGSAVHLGTQAEVENLDLVTAIDVSEENSDAVRHHLIIWENKIKAGFSQKKVTQLPLSAHSSEITKQAKDYEKRYLRGISQPYWYQIRWLLWMREEGQDTWRDFLKKVAPATWADETVEVHWMILSLFDQKSLETFYAPFWKGSGWHEGNEPVGDQILTATLDHDTQLNDWKFMTYSELVGELRLACGNLQQSPLTSYVGFLEDEFGDAGSPLTALVSTSGTNAQDWNLTKLLALFDPLKRLNAFDFFWEPSGSSNSGFPLLNISLRPGGRFENAGRRGNEIWSSAIAVTSSDLQTSDVDFIKCSIQIQQTVKLQFAHHAYDIVRLKNRDAYISAVFDCLGCPADNSSTSQGRKEFIETIINAQGRPTHSNKFIAFRENKPFRKTGLSYTIRLTEAEKGIVELTEIEHVVQLCSQLHAWMLTFRSTHGHTG